MEKLNFIKKEEPDIFTEIYPKEETKINKIFLKDFSLKTKEDIFNETNSFVKEENIFKKEEESILIHSKKEADDTLTKIMPKQKETVSQSLYNKSYSRTWFSSSIVEYTWEIDRAITLFKITKEFFSTMFPETGLYRIKLTIDTDTSEILKSILKFYLLTETEFIGVCDVCVINPTSFHKILCQSTSGLITNMTLLYETTLELLEKYLFVKNSLTLYFEFEILNQFFTRSIHMNVIPSSTTLDKELIRDCSLLNFIDKEIITFKIKGECYNLPEKVLRATNSKYFNKICDLFENIKDRTYKIEVNDMPMAFKEMLSFILSGLLPDLLNYYKLRDLLLVAHKYDVQTLKVICEQYLLRMINIQNSIDLIQLAFSCNAKSLEKYTALFIKLYLKEVLHIKEFQLLSQTDVDKIIELISNIKIPLESQEFINLPRLNTPQYNI
ncbi:uncharacterized protein [Anoplolepis gracilipes]|uniref:uncharacterized protein n=1 Tax=Anoplolepis gracilipes TaxID=354296 RepID=UPI003BA18B84